MSKTVEELEALKAGLFERLREEVEGIAAPTDNSRIETAAQMYLAINAVKEVIERVRSEEKPFDPNRISRTL